MPSLTFAHSSTFILEACPREFAACGSPPFWQTDRRSWPIRVVSADLTSGAKHLQTAIAERQQQPDSEADAGTDR
jgi:hypothetical protein